MNFFNNTDKSERNDFDENALLQESEDTIKSIKHAPESASPDFEHTLKMKILERRRTSSIMDTVFVFLNSFMRPKRLVPMVSVLVLVAIVLQTTNISSFMQIAKEDPFGQFSKLIISPAHAADNFTFAPVAMDSLGVPADGSYILTSKEPVDTTLIKESLVVEPDVPYTIEQISDTEWKVTPKDSLPANTVLKVSLSTAFYDTKDRLQSRDYSWAYQVKDSFKVLTNLPRNQATNVPVNTGIEITFSHDNFTDYEQYLSIEPQFKYRLEKHGRVLVLAPLGTLTLATVYTVTAKRGLPLSGTQEALAEDFVFQFETAGASNTGTYQSYFNVYNPFMEVATSEPPVVQVYASSKESNPVQVDVYTLSSPNQYIEALGKRDQIPWWAHSKDNYQYDTDKLTRMASFSTEIKKSQYVQYLDFPEPLPPGFYVVNFTLGNEKEQSWIQVTNVSAYFNITKTDTIVWAHNMATNQPIAGAAVSVIGEAGAYRTDANGVARFATPEVLRDTADKDSYYFDITAGNGRLIMSASRTSSSYYYDYDSGVSEANDYWHYVYTDRPKYQPTDTIKLWGMVKRRDNTSVTDDVRLVLVKNGYVDYYYRPVNVAESAVHLTDRGTFEGELPLDGVNPDYYTIELLAGDTVLASQYILIQPYVKPTYQLSLTPDRTKAFAGETINFDVQASFFEGTPVPNLDLVFKMPEGDYAFTTDEQGKARLTYTKAYQPCGSSSSSYSCWPRGARLSIMPKNAELAEITAEQYIAFYGPEVFMRSEVTYPEKGIAELTVSTYGIDMHREGTAKYGDDVPVAPNTRISGEVIKTTHTQNQTGTYYDFISKKTYPEYSYAQHDETVDSFSATTDANGEYVRRITVESETSYRIRLKVYDVSEKYDLDSAYAYYYDGRHTKSYGSSYRHDYTYLEFPNGTNYSIGDHVVADISNDEGSLPEGDGSQYLFLQLQNGLQEYAASNNSAYSFTFEKRDVPNVSIEGVRFKDGAYHANSGTVLFNKEDRELSISVSSDQDQYGPGEEATLSVRVTDKQGNPQRAAVNVNVVDEAYYAMVNDVADPLARVYATISAGSYFSSYSHKPLSDATAAEKGGCFLAGTQILMADGTTKPIEDIREGDVIRTLSDPLRLTQATGTVTQTFRHLVGGYLIINGTLRVTPEHLVYANHSFRSAGSLTQGDWLLAPDGTKVFITSIERKQESVEVYNFTVDPQHTYIADGFYVHNDKGDGVREYFTDAPLFKSVVTDQSGRANLTFTLPDNITSWRATVQAISDSLYIGTETANLKVSLPVFADITVGSEYLAADKPVVRMRAFGTALTGADSATFTVESKSLGAKESDPISVKAFQSAYAALPTLTVGTHDVQYNLTTEKGNDAVRLPINVITSRLSVRTQENGILTSETRITSPSGSSVQVLLGDRTRIQLAAPLQRLTWSWGDRADQIIPRAKSVELLNELFGEDRAVPAVEPYVYQQSDGGISLLPYSSSDLELSAKMALAASDIFDQQALTQYFLRVFNSTQSNREEITLSLLGLAALDVPVLPVLNNWRVRDDLSVKEYMYIALAATELGADELGRSIYYSLMSQYAHEKLPDIIIRVSDNEVETRQLTALAAILGAAVGAPEREGLWSAVRAFNRSNELLLDLEKFAYVEESLQHTIPQDAAVTYTVAGKEQDASFGRSFVHRFEVSAQDAPGVRFIAIAGDVGITTITEQPIQASNIARDTDIGIWREYLVGGKQTTELKEGDEVEVRLHLTISSQALRGSYQVTDILPSGLLPITKRYTGYYGGGCHNWYPYNIDGQKVKYQVWDSWNNTGCGNYISYFARVKTKGTYAAEPAVLQSMLNPDFINYSDAQTVTIR
ncbi:hypothetical protein BK004_03620 [bacterium CG10_46_32]|nr:MAG: hypothetical protein BK004_03620 [bacterium CG10_46_32]PIR55887.1 MAG: hypothetical protein COU73_03650 [Parcubacteria group bacterium CG10_big_fil_rev_8_21_14_0_10_46_32]